MPIPDVMSEHTDLADILLSLRGVWDEERHESEDDEDDDGLAAYRFDQSNDDDDDDEESDGLDAYERLADPDTQAYFSSIQSQPAPDRELIRKRSDRVADVCA